MSLTPPTQRALALDASARVDDRGVKVQERALRTGSCPTYAAPEVRGAIARYRATLASTWLVRYLQAVAALATVALGVGLGFWLVNLTNGESLSDGLFFLVGFVTGILPGAIVAVAMVRGDRRFQRVACRNLLLGIGRCPACGFAIGGNVRPMSDGCAACGECGAAWFAERIAPITVDEADAWQTARVVTAIQGASQHVSGRRDARGRRVVTSAGLALPRHGPWSVGLRIYYTIMSGLVGGIVLSVSLAATFAVSMSVVSLIEWPKATAFLSTSSLTAVTLLVVLIPLVFLVPIAAATTATSWLRFVALRRASLCPACESPIDDAGASGLTVECRFCNAVWKR
ncbi:MAG: hypothetical protein JNM94_04600 [Phycisphaerae bacterium]|nr:hypothetical protein [Phycisphaerae bacterium]